MSVGSNLQEMENVVTKGSAASEPMQKMTTGIPDGQSGNWEDLGGPTPENYKSDDDSAKLSEPKIATVNDIVNRCAKSAEPMPKMANPVKEEEELEGEVVSEEEISEEDTEQEIVAEEEVAEEDNLEEPLVEYDIEEDINALLKGESLSEEFEERARLIFETAINTKVSEIKEDLQNQYEETLEEEVLQIKEELVTRVDAYLEYVAEEWITENQLSIERGIKLEMTDSFLEGMKNLFEEHYVNIPEDKYDVTSAMVEKLDEMEIKLNEQIQKNVALNKRLAESVADVIFSEVCEGLALSQKDKLASLAENVEFDGEKNYREKLVALRESYFSVNASAQRDDSDDLSEEVEMVDVKAENHYTTSPLMESCLSIMDRVSKK